jgi:hypothetical protein
MQENGAISGEEDPLNSLDPGRRALVEAMLRNMALLVT